MSETTKAVKISNELVRSAQKLKLSEKRLLMMLVSKVTNENIYERIAVTAIEYADFYGVSRTSSYQTIAAARNGIFDRFFVIGDQDCHWFKNRTRDTKGYVEIVFHEDIRHHIHDLKKFYTHYYLRRAGNFKHIYSWRLFELLMQFRKTGLLRMELAEFRDILEVPTAYDRDFALVRHKVINKALAEIKESGLPVKLKTIKKGRTVHMLEFTFPLEQQADWVKGASPKKTAKQQTVTADYLARHKRQGETKADANERLQAELDSGKARV